MAEEEANKIEVERPPTEPPPPATTEETPAEEKSIVPVTPVEDKPDALVVVEKAAEHCEEKPAEGSVHRDAVLARVATEKKDALIKAWEESEKSKAENKAQKKLSVIGAWENSKKATIEAEMKLIEEKLEKKSEYIEKLKNEIATIHQTAEEKRAITEAKRGEELLKAEELAAKCRATGSSPKKLLGWFSS